MKRSKLDVDFRRDEILKLLANNGNLSVEAISQMLEFSPSTIRRDIRQLITMGKVMKQHGLITLKDFFQIDTDANDEIELIKREIGKAAAKLISEKKTIFVNSGSTPLYTLRGLQDKQVTIISNNIKVAAIEHHPKSLMLLSGGEVRLPRETLVGDVTVNFFQNIRADACILGVHGVSIENGITTPNMNEARINKTIIDQTKGPVIVVADYRKIGAVSNFKSGDISRVNYVVTDSFADDRTVAQLEKAGIIVIQVAI